MSKTIGQVTEELAAKRKVLATVFEEAGEDYDMSKVKVIDGDSASKVDAIKTINKELNDLEDTRKGLAELEGIKGANAKIFNQEMKERAEIKPDTKDVKPKSIGEMFTESGAIERKGTPVKVEDVETKTLMTAAAGWDPENIRIPRVVLTAQQALGVIDFIPQGTCNSDLIKYMAESTFTNSAAEASEGGTYGEAALALTETSKVVEKLAVWLPVTDEQLEDVAGLQSYINSRLNYMIRSRLESQLLVGDGSTPNLRGTLNLSSIQSQAKGTYSTPDAIHLALTKVRVTGFAEPNVVVMHPNDWQDIRLLTTADGIYIFGSPSEATPPRIWGLPVAVTTFETENTAIVGAYAGYSMLFMRKGVEFNITDSHGDYFVQGKQAIRCDMRCCLVHFRETAFCKVTGI